MPPEHYSARMALTEATARLAAGSETPRLDAELLMAHALGVSRETVLLGGLDRAFPASPAIAHPPTTVGPEPVEGHEPDAGPAACPSTSLRTNGEGEAPQSRGDGGSAQSSGGAGEPRSGGKGGGLCPGETADRFWSLVARRASGEPLAYITGTRAFWTIDLAVAPGVLIPRPDSETLIEAAVAHFAGTPGPRRILDLGTGSGALLLASLAEWPRATGVGIDRSQAALAIAQANALALGMAGRAEMIAGDWSGTGEAFDLVLCNPPYIATDEGLPRDVADHEPHSALFAGPYGLDDYCALAPLLPTQIAAGGIACIEIGATQGDAVSALLRAQGLVVQIRHDLAGRERCVAAMR